jgi:predicted esterase
LLLHGCGQHASDFYALLEESKMAAAVLDRGFVVFAPDATPAPGDCWELTHDGPLVRDALKEFLRSRHLQNRPVYGIGLSNGGAMLEYMFSVLNVSFAGLHFNVGPAASHPDRDDVWSFFWTKKHPPVSFVRMFYDSYIPRQRLEDAAAFLRQMHTPVQEFHVPSLPLGYLVAQAKQIGVSESVLDNVVKKLITWGYTELRSGVIPYKRSIAFKTADYKRFLKVGRAPEAIKRLSSDPQLGILLKPRLNAFTEQLQLVEGWHCPTAEHINESLDFLLNSSQLDSTRLALSKF